MLNLMTLWLILTLMTAAALFAVLWPIRQRDPDIGGSDIAVYRDQLEEIDRDRAAGLIGVLESEAAKVEVSRRLIAAADSAELDRPAPEISSPWRRRTVAISGLLLLPIASILLYLMLGSPQLPGMPLAARAQALSADPSIESLIARVEDHVERNPNDGRAWEVLAPVYMRIGRFDDAVRAWRNAISLNGSSASREADLGEALVAAGNGIVTAEAKVAFDRALALDDQDVMARFYIGMAADQDGRRAEAEAIWRDLLAHAPAGAPWVAMVRHAMERNAPAGTAPRSAAASAPGPSAADIAAAAKLAPDQQSQMINGMVARLADRLKKDGSDAEGWVQLVRSYRVLGQNDKADTAIADARRALASDPDKLRQFAESVEEATPAGAEALVAPTASAVSPPGPSAVDIAAAAQMSPDQKNQMISGMVARLADKLKQDGSDVDGWLRLLRAYTVLGERDKAQAAAADARHALASDPDKLRRVEETIKSLGLEG
jgi:cytochrome c-type biogenesis protein CcmH